jgi:hypothetical protein
MRKQSETDAGRQEAEVRRRAAQAAARAILGTLASPALSLGVDSATFFPFFSNNDLFVLLDKKTARGGIRM